MASGRPKMVPGRPKIGPIWAQYCPRWLQGGFKMAQDGPNDAPKVALETAAVGGFQKQAFRLDKTNQVFKILIEIGRK